MAGRMLTLVPVFALATAVFGFILADTTTTACTGNVLRLETAGANAVAEDSAWTVSRRGSEGLVRPENGSQTQLTRFGVPTPVVYNGVPQRIRSAHVFYHIGKNATITGFDFNDGHVPRLKMRGLNFRSTNDSKQLIEFYLPDQPYMTWGSWVSVQVSFEGNGTDAFVGFISAGVDYIGALPGGENCGHLGLADCNVADALRGSDVRLFCNGNRTGMAPGGNGTVNPTLRIGFLNLGSLATVPKGLPASTSGPQFLSVLDDDWTNSTQPPGQNLLVAVNVKFASRAHGASDVQVDNPKWSVVRQGFVSTMRPNGDSLSGWVHFLVHTPSIANNTRLRLGAAYLKFSTGKDAGIVKISVNDGDGPSTNEKHDGYNLTGPKQVAFYNYGNKGPLVFWAIDIALFLQFKNQGSDAWVRLAAAGIDFV